MDIRGLLKVQHHAFTQNRGDGGRGSTSPVCFILSRKLFFFFLKSQKTLGFIGQNCHMVTPGWKRDGKSRYLLGNLADLIKIGIPFITKIRDMGIVWGVNSVRCRCMDC